MSMLIFGVDDSPSAFRRLRIRTALKMSAFSIILTSAGFLLASAPAISPIISILSAPTDAESVRLYRTPDQAAAGINDFLINHPLSIALRSSKGWMESRPHVRFPNELKKHSLTAGTLLGHGKVPVPPLVFTNPKCLVSLAYLGTDLCGHAGMVHGGMLATMMDEGLARCSFSSFPSHVGVTANLNINYRKPTPAGSFVVLKAETVRVEGRKVWVKGRIETLEENDKAGILLVEAEGLFIEPKYAKVGHSL